MKSTLKDKLVLILTGIIIFGFFLFGIFSPDKDYSLSERRLLAQFPGISAQSISSGSFMNRFESYSQDQFPLRDAFRSLKALVLKYGFAQKDNHGLYTVGNQIGKLEYPLNQKNFNRNIQKILDVKKKYLDESGCTPYLCIIPDKNYFLAPLGGFPTMDYQAFTESVVNSLDFAENIEITSLLKLEDYYLTDQHWRQENILPVAEKIAHAMNNSFSGEYEKIDLDTPFYGTYYGQAALPAKPDSISYLTSDILKSCKVTSYDTGKAKESAVYTLEKAESKDPYEIFLDGANALLVIENENANSNKELVVFRDSFGSSLVPLLVDAYKTITVVDLRYIGIDQIEQFVSFDQQDVLFLYSTLVLNNSIAK